MRNGLARGMLAVGRRVRAATRRAVLGAGVVVLLASAPAAAQAPVAQTAADAALAMRVEAALASASDVPADSIAVQVRGGGVTLTGSVVCDGCGGRSTPGGTGTVQQSLGAVVRAVPGVERVEFRLRYGPS
ncbi:MAG TPA: BON domain-containing protein [Longimicrobiales bacterium]|nr:BON domain-containing protein [Longimicrobiales bacterium]